ncbi:hypothetical protein ILUMI_11475 [Ignelater luminosus]|uniref:Uncharacterized protein n=1 Tax=Ignelater luminosus TaxID=2038154 RepID=A0A8K0CVW8_IGNLU|nr:hypothetical protein ILUMI_11475 [Ignelater luminosus]
MRRVTIQPTTKLSGEGDFFRASKLTKRTPNKNSGDDVQEMKELLKTLVNNNTEVIKELKEIRKEQQVYHTEMKKLRDENQEMKKKKSYEKKVKSRTKNKISKKIGETVSLVKLENYTEKEKVMKNKIKLRSNEQKIFINDDLTKEHTSMQKHIRDVKWEERKKGNRTKIKDLKIYINEEVWKWNKQTSKFVENKQASQH